MSWGFQGIISSVANFLGVPIGATYRPRDRGENREIGNKSYENSDLIKSILDMTVDDVCIGAAPFYYRCSDDADADAVAKFNKILKELNSVSRWIARDLLSEGVSCYEIEIEGREVYFYPVLGTLKYVLNKKKEVVVYDENDNKITDCIVFINYDKTSLKDITDKNHEYQITPKGIQLGNVNNTLKELDMIEKALLRYRRDLSRIVRFVFVEVGVSQGNKQQEVIDTISSGINANSLAFETNVDDMFDDEIPVFPTRKGLGKPEYEEHIPNANISDLADLDHTMDKLLLSMRIPKSYVTFGEALSATAVSTIRGDIRYSRMLQACRNCMLNTSNEYFGKTEAGIRYNLKFKMQTIPNPEDSEVVESLNSFSEFIQNSFEAIFGDSETKEEAYYKLLSYKILLGDSANLKSIDRWFNLTKRYINRRFSDKEQEQVEDDMFGDEKNIDSNDDEMETIPDLEGNNKSEESIEETGEESEGGEAEEFAPSEVPPQFP